MKTINKLILGVLALLSSNFAFAQDLLIKAENVPKNSLWDIFMKAPAEVILFVIIAYFYRKLSSK